MTIPAMAPPPKPCAAAAAAIDTGAAEGATVGLAMPLVVGAEEGFAVGETAPLLLGITDDGRIVGIWDGTPVG